MHECEDWKQPESAEVAHEEFSITGHTNPEGIHGVGDLHVAARHCHVRGPTAPRTRTSSRLSRSVTLSR